MRFRKVPKASGKPKYTKIPKRDKERQRQRVKRRINRWAQTLWELKVNGWTKPVEPWACGNAGKLKNMVFHIKVWERSF